MKALIDADILRYEVGFAAQAGWKKITDRDEIPPFDYVTELLNQRIEQIVVNTESNDYTLYLTEGRTFRFDLAKRRPYKGTRVVNKPWHFNNLTVYMRDVLPTVVVQNIEADDAIAIEHCTSKEPTIICSRDKDLRQVPGMFYSWELGKQPSFGPIDVDPVGWIELSDDRKKVTGCGFAFFCAQMLMGDRVDNIPGVDGMGPVAVANLLKGPYSPINPFVDLLDAVEGAYQDCYRDDWEEELVEQGRLCWIVRRLNDDGSPQIWERGMYV